MTTTFDIVPHGTNGLQSGKSDNSEWQGCYGESWSDITPESFSHPAKFSRALIRRIYRHAIKQGWIKAGDWVVDPFGGSGLGAKDALYFGINWFGNELEPRFVDMGAGCDCTGISKADWVKFYGRWDRFNHKDGRHFCPTCLSQARQVITPSSQLSLFEKPDLGAAYIRNSGLIPETKPHRYEGNLARFHKHAKAGARAILVQGDSRKLAEIVKGRMAGMISSPPYGNNSKADYAKEERDPQDQGRGSFRGFYGHTDGQLAKLSEGDPDAIIGSPPYAGARIPQGGVSNSGPGGLRRPTDKGRYGQTDGQLGDLPEGRLGLDSLISSPPYEGIRMDGGGDFAKNGKGGMRPYTDESVDAWRTTRDQDNLGDLPPGGFNAVIGSPPFAGNSGGRGEASRNGIDPGLFERHSGGMVGGLGDNKDNLGNMKPGDIEAVIGSPPYANQPTRTGKVDEDSWNDGRSRPVGASQKESVGYGETSGQLGSMPAGDVSAVIGSPPYIGSLDRGTVSKQARVNLAREQGISNAEHISPIDMEKIGQRTQGDYGITEGQLGAMPEGEASAVIGSPPYVGSLKNQDDSTISLLRAHLSKQQDPDRPGAIPTNGYGQSQGQLGNLPQGDADAIIGSPPFGQATQSGGTNIYNQLEQTHERKFTDSSRRNGYRADQQGDSPGQLADLSEGDADAVIGSPPFVGSVGSDDPEKRGGLFRDPKRAGDKNLTGTYGSTPGQLGAMVQGEADEGHMAAMRSSPPYGKDTVNDRNGIDASKFDRYGKNSQAVTMNGYGHTEGQLNNLRTGPLDMSILFDHHVDRWPKREDQQTKETFWQAAKIIVQQCHEILKPGGVAIWVCKDFVRDGARVRFCDQWRRLCESVGFEHLETHRAMLVKYKGSQTTLEGDLVELKSEHKSFFRRLHESKPDAIRIDWEEVIVLRKPFDRRLSELADEHDLGSCTSDIYQ